MKKHLGYALAATILISACTDQKGERALTGAATGALVGTSIIIGAAVIYAGSSIEFDDLPDLASTAFMLGAPAGALGGAAIGLATTTDRIDLDGSSENNAAE